MRKWICMLLSALLVTMPLLSFAEETADKLEISFRVGDDTLRINGADVQVEKPYVVGVGVTLVPLRVITEAFGATVDWIAETQTIQLSYQNVEMILQIGNGVAEVNGKAETLLSAPELTANGFTMVPLRFISETFGATVSYDDATSAITVAKETAPQEGTLVQGAIDKSRIGDNYYGWSMDTPADMQMTQRRFDGMITRFEKDENNGIEISIQLRPEEYDFNRDFNTTKESLADMTLVAADKNTDDSRKQVMHFQAKDKEEYIDFWQYVTDKYVYIAYGSFDATDTETRTEGVRLLKSFDVSYTTTDTYNLSNIKGNSRTFSAEGMNFEIDIPETFYLYSSENVENEFAFRKMDINDSISTIDVGIYSISAEGSAKELAEKDYANNKKLFNPELVSFNKIKEQIYTNVKTYEYEVKIDSVSEKSYHRDVFFELGAYVYNVSVKIKLPDDMAAATTNEIINSIQLDYIDADEVGILMRNVKDLEGTYKVRGNKWSMQVPNGYTEMANSGDSVLLMNAYNGTGIQIDIENGDEVAFVDIMDYARERQKELKTDKEVTILKPVDQIRLDEARFSEVIYSRESEDNKIFARELMGLKNRKVIIVSIMYSELSYGDLVVDETDAILESIQFE